MLATMLDKVQTLGHQAGRFEEMVGMLQRLTGVRAQLLDAVKLMNVDTPRPQVGTEVHAQLRKANDTLKALKALKADLPKPEMDSQASDHHVYTIMSLLGLAAFIAVSLLDLSPFQPGRSLRSGLGVQPGRLVQHPCRSGLIP
jgi:hypothetical protein